MIVDHDIIIVLAILYLALLMVGQLPLNGKFSTNPNVMQQILPAFGLHPPINRCDIDTDIKSINTTRYYYVCSQVSTSTQESWRSPLSHSPLLFSLLKLPKHPFALVFPRLAVKLLVLLDPIVFRVIATALLKTPLVVVMLTIVGTASVTRNSKHMDVFPIDIVIMLFLLKPLVSSSR